MLAIELLHRSVPVDYGRPLRNAALCGASYIAATEAVAVSSELRGRSLQLQSARSNYMPFAAHIHTRTCYIHRRTITHFLVTHQH